VIEQTDSPLPGSSLPELDGSWEKAHRSPTAAAFFGLVIVGVIYFHAQTIISVILILINRIGNPIDTEGKTFIEKFMQMTILMKNPVRYSLVISQFVFMLIPTLYIVKRWHTKRIFSYIRFKLISPAEFFLAIAVTICFIPISGYIGDFFMKQLNFPDFLANISTQIFTSYSIIELLVLIFIVCLTPALCEEILFRGYVQRTLERTFGVKSFIIVGIIFGLYHMQPLNLVSLSLLGILIGYFYHRSRSIVPCIVAHLTNNLIAVLSLYKMEDGQLVISIFSYEINLILVTIGLLFGGGLLFAYYYATQKNFKEQPA
jgi:membrane protease YdiL (CAAX protease family)